MKKLKVGLVGTGGIGVHVHLPAWHANPNVEIVALCDIVVDKAFAAAKKYNVPHVFEKYEDLIAMKEIDVVDICTPNYLHSIIAIMAMENGKHVFCEKPDAINQVEATKMKAASEATGKMLMVMRNNRFNDFSKFLKPYIEEGNLGHIYAAKCGWVRRRGVPGGWFSKFDESGGGPLIDLGVHMIDLAIWLMGNPKPVAVSGSTYGPEPTPTADVEDYVAGFVRFDNGASLSVECSWRSNVEREKRFVELIGTKQGAKWDSDDEQLKIFGQLGDATADFFPNVKQGGPEFGHGGNINHFVRCLLKGEKPIFVPEQGLDMIKILDAIYLSAKEKREIVL